MYAQFQSKGLVFYRIAIKESPNTVRQFLEKESLQFPVLLDQDGRVGRLFGLWMTPTNYLINRRGMVCNRVMGVTDWTGPVTNLIDQFLRER